jgi:di/tricarboxylate transporter
MVKMNWKHKSIEPAPAVALILLVVYVTTLIWNNLRAGKPIQEVGPLFFSTVIILLLGFGIATQIRKSRLIEPMFFIALFGLVLYPILEMLGSQTTGIPLQELLYNPIPILMFMGLAFVLGFGTKGQVERLRQRRRQSQV